MLFHNVDLKAACQMEHWIDDTRKRAVLSKRDEVAFEERCGVVKPAATARLLASESAAAEMPSMLPRRAKG
jgi:hypothetical protein